MLAAHHITAFVTLLLSAPVAFAAQQTQGIDEQAKLPYWEINDKGMSLRLVQRLPVQSRAFFLARGFSKAQVERVANNCIFQTVFKNTSQQSTPSVLEYDLRDWKVTTGSKSSDMKIREDWIKEWQSIGVAKSQVIAFEWSMYPTAQSYKPGDYNWGMSDFDLRPGTKFDLQISWQQFGQSHRAVIKNMQCAADINPQPAEAQ